MAKRAFPVLLVLPAKEVLRLALIVDVGHMHHLGVQIVKRVHKDRWLPLSWQQQNV